MNNYTNNEPNNPHGFKEQVKIKYEATKAIDAEISGSWMYGMFYELLW